MVSAQSTHYVHPIQTIQFNSILLSYLDITYNNLILIYNVVQTVDDETNNILCTTRHT